MLKTSWKWPLRVIAELSLLAGGWGLTYDIPGKGWQQTTARVIHSTQTEELTKCLSSRGLACSPSRGVQIEYVLTVDGKAYKGRGWMDELSLAFQAALAPPEAPLTGIIPSPRVSVLYDPEDPGRSFETRSLELRTLRARTLYLILVFAGILAYLSSTGTPEKRQKRRQSKR